MKWDWDLAIHISVVAAMAGIAVVCIVLVYLMRDIKIFLEKGRNRINFDRIAEDAAQRASDLVSKSIERKGEDQ